MLNYEPCFTCEKPINMGLPALFIVAACEECEEVSTYFVFCSEKCRDNFVPPSDEEMHDLECDCD